MLSPQGPLGKNGNPESDNDLSLILLLLLKAKKGKERTYSLVMGMRQRVG